MSPKTSTVVSFSYLSLVLVQWWGLVSLERRRPTPRVCHLTRPELIAHLASTPSCWQTPTATPIRHSSVSRSGRIFASSSFDAISIFEIYTSWHLTSLIKWRKIHFMSTSARCAGTTVLQLQCNGVLQNLDKRRGRFSVEYVTRHGCHLFWPLQTCPRTSGLHCFSWFLGHQSSSNSEFLFSKSVSLRGKAYIWLI